MKKARNDKLVLFKTFILATAFFTTNLLSAQDFKTEWSFQEATQSIVFNALTSGNVDYTWTTSPSGNSGSGRILTAVSSCYGMFRGCEILEFVPNINQWNTANVTDMSNMFSSAHDFNQDNIRR